ncbi:MAG: Spy/CpxP family protein refolding chaperone [Candidatus Coatesbacteria bacterium]|mgnify:CR=1 FL=1
MRQVACAIAVVALIGSVAVTPALAGPARPMPAGQGAARPVGPAPIQGPEAMIAKVLELAPAQQTQWKAEVDRTQAVSGPLWETLGAQTAELKALVDRKAADADVKAKLDAVNATRGAIRTEQDKHEANVLAMLTPPQGAKFTMMFADRLRQGWGRPMPRGAARPPVR